MDEDGLFVEEGSLAMGEGSLAMEGNLLPTYLTICGLIIETHGSET